MGGTLFRDLLGISSKTIGPHDLAKECTDPLNGSLGGFRHGKVKGLMNKDREPSPIRQP